MHIQSKASITQRRQRLRVCPRARSARTDTHENTHGTHTDGLTYEHTHIRAHIRAHIRTHTEQLTRALATTTGPCRQLCTSTRRAGYIRAVQPAHRIGTTHDRRLRTGSWCVHSARASSPSACSRDGCSCSRRQTHGACGQRCRQPGVRTPRGRQGGGRAWWWRGCRRAGSHAQTRQRRGGGDRTTGSVGGHASRWRRHKRPAWRSRGDHSSDTDDTRRPRAL
jgi:hypothetical protein